MTDAMDDAPESHQFWAKLRYRDDDPSTGDVVDWHPLLAHSADVAAVTEALLDRTVLGARLARLAGLDATDGLDAVHVARLSALAALHDAGKVNHGFQGQAFGRGWNPGHVAPIVRVLASRKHVDRLLGPLGIEEMLDGGWFATPKSSIHYMIATWSHHGRPVSHRDGNFRPDLWREDHDDRNPIAKLGEIGEAARDWFPRAFEDAGKPLPDAPAFQHAFNGVLTLADWLGSSREYFDFQDEGEDPWENAQEGVEKALTKLALDPSPPRNSLTTAVGYDQVLKKPDWSPRPVQRAVRTLDVHRNGSLAILESDTGSGKTEAAIARFFQLYQAGLVDGMYFAVPTRSAATQLYGRVDETVKRVFPDDATHRPPVVQAVPGYIKVDDVEGVPLDRFDVQWPDDPSDAERERRWAAQHPKRYLAGAIVVGTVDQVLLSALQVQHAHMRAAALLRHFLVVDEIHASDVYMTRLLERVLDQHVDAGGHALLMSATLGTSSRTRLLTGDDDRLSPEDAEAEDYPLVVQTDASRTDPSPEPIPSDDREEGEEPIRAKTVRPEARSIAGSPEAIAREAAEAAGDGARVLVIRNTVTDCIDTQKRLVDHLGADSPRLFRVDEKPVPHHSRFAPADRKKLDDRIETVFGGEEDEERCASDGVVAVATQTVEQSLDIDADLMITDLCPVDVLLQRIGRLHRHDRDRPGGYEKTRCIVVVPEDRDLAAHVDEDEHHASGPHGLGTVYRDLRVLEATWVILEGGVETPWKIPEHNRKLVERGTHPDRLYALVEEEGELWQKHHRWVWSQRRAEEQASGLVALERGKKFGEQGFADDLHNVRTRLGDDDVHVDLPSAPTGPFGEVSELTLPGWLFDEEPDDEEGEVIEQRAGGFRFTFAGKRFGYDHHGILKIE
jgi:CRISPR-associated endonuclease/helicase Cas3